MWVERRGRRGTLALAAFRQSRLPHRALETFLGDSGRSENQVWREGFTRRKPCTPVPMTVMIAGFVTLLGGDVVAIFSVSELGVKIFGYCLDNGGVTRVVTLLGALSWSSDLFRCRWVSSVGSYVLLVIFDLLCKGLPYGSLLSVRPLILSIKRGERLFREVLTIAIF